MRAEVRRLEALTGLRFVAAAAVVLFHIPATGSAELFGLRPDFIQNVPLGTAGVTFFFILSGFILTYVYPRLGTWPEVGRFLLARFARLWPGYLFAIVVSMVLAGAVFWPSPEAVYHPFAVLGVHLAMLQSWVPSHSMSRLYNGPLWSVSTEFAFYLLYVPLVAAWSRTWWWKLPLLMLPPVGLAVAAKVYGWEWYVGPGRFSYEHVMYFNPLARVWQFALGMAACLAWKRVAPRLRPGPVAGTALELAALALVVASNLYAAEAGAAAFQSPQLGPPFYNLLYVCSALTAVPFALFLFVAASGWGYLSRLFATAPAVLLGEISYGVYVLHWPLLTYLTAHKAAFAGVPGWQVLAGYWGMLLLLAHWTHVTIERPARRWLVALWPAEPGAPRPAPAAPSRAAAAWRVGETLLVAAAALAVASHISRATFRYVSPARLDNLVKFAPSRRAGSASATPTSCAGRRCTRRGGVL